MKCFKNLFASAIFLVCLASAYKPNVSEYVQEFPVVKLHDLRGEILSPEYHVNMCYRWFIHVSPGYTITISFNDLDFPIKLGQICNKSYVEVRDIENRQLLRYCVNILKAKPPAFISDKSVLVTLKTGPVGFGRGFSLNYITGQVSLNDSCRADEFHCSSGKCIYEKWHCNGIKECEDGSDEICPNGTKPPQPPVTEYCPAGKFSCISKDTGQHVCLWHVRKCDGIFDCISRIDERNCQASCGGHLQEPIGIIQSPKFAHGYYPGNLNCQWVIHAPKGVHIQLRFGVFDLEMPSDYITIYDGPIYSHNIGRFSKDLQPPRIIESMTSEIVFVFHSGTSATLGKISHGFNVTYQQKGFCFHDQKSCAGENNCYDSIQHCNGVWDCARYGSDEKDCRNCKDADAFPCSHDSSRCYKIEERCNGLGYCLDNKDEMNCNSDVCGPHNGTYLCRNKKCIYESWICDGTNDCDDGSDEEKCPAIPSVRVILAAVVGSLICGLVLVIALGCTIKLFALRLHESGSAFDTPMSRLQAEFMRIPAPPPYNEAMRTSRPFDEVMAQLRAGARRGQRGVHQLCARIYGGEQGENSGSTEALMDDLPDNYVIIHSVHETNSHDANLQNIPEGNETSASESGATTNNPNTAIDVADDTEGIANPTILESSFEVEISGNNNRSRNVSGESSDSDCILLENYRLLNVHRPNILPSNMPTSNIDTCTELNDSTQLDGANFEIGFSGSSNSVCILADDLSSSSPNQHLDLQDDENINQPLDEVDACQTYDER